MFGSENFATPRGLYAAGGKGVIINFAYAGVADTAQKLNLIVGIALKIERSVQPRSTLRTTQLHHPS